MKTSYVRALQVYTALALIGAAAGSLFWMDMHPAHHAQKELYCCQDPVAMAQQNRPEKGLSRALCGQHHGSVIEVDGIFVDCIGGN